MAHYQEVDYRSEEVRSLASPGGGMQERVVRETTVQEVDSKAPHAAGHRHGHRGRHGSGHLVVRETTVEEDVNSCAGEFHQRKESIVVRD